MMYFYKIYGLTISISHPLPLLEPAALGVDDVEVCFDLSNNLAKTIYQENKWKTSTLNSDNGIVVQHSQHWISLAYSRSTTESLTFYISRDGSRVVCEKPDAIPVSDAESFIVGPILGCVLRLRQRICLHASVMEFEGKAFAFVGNKGAGKSTTAAALLHAGARLVSDDVAVLNAKDINDTDVQSGYPGVRLLPSTLLALGLSENNYDRVVSGSNKRYVPLEKAGLVSNNNTKNCKNSEWQFQPASCPLSVIYALNPRQADLKQTEITTLTNQEALMALAPHGYGRRILNSAKRAEEFKYIAQLSQRIAVKSISCPDKLPLLTQIADNILNDVRNTST